MRRWRSPARAVSCACEQDFCRCLLRMNRTEPNRWTFEKDPNRNESNRTGSFLVLCATAARTNVHKGACRGYSSEHEGQCGQRSCPLVVRPSPEKRETSEVPLRRLNRNSSNRNRSRSSPVPSTSVVVFDFCSASPRWRAPRQDVHQMATWPIVDQRSYNLQALY